MEKVKKKNKLNLLLDSLLSKKNNKKETKNNRRVLYSIPLEDMPLSRD